MSKTVYIVLYTNMNGQSDIVMVYSDEQRAIDFCDGRQCYSYEAWAVF